MLGDSFLVAPIFNEEGTAEYYLPEGIWTNYLTGEQAEGGKWRKERHGYCSIPLWVREGSVIPTAPGRLRAEGGMEDLEWKVYLGKGKSRGTIYEKGRAVYSLEAEPQEKGLALRFLAEGKNGHGQENQEGSPAPGNSLKIRLVNCLVKETDCGTIEKEGKDTLIILPGGVRTVNCQL